MANHRPDAKTAQFRDVRSFSKIMEMAALPGEVLEYLIGDTITEGLANILYNTFDGNVELLEDAVQNDGTEQRWRKLRCAAKRWPVIQYKIRLYIGKQRRQCNAAA